VDEARSWIETRNWSGLPGLPRPVGSLQLEVRLVPGPDGQADREDVATRRAGRIRSLVGWQYPGRTQSHQDRPAPHGCRFSTASATLSPIVRAKARLTAARCRWPPAA